MPPRLVRRQTLYQRISAFMNPWDFLLWLSEEIETRELDSATVGNQAGLVANFLFLLARANLGPSSNADDDVFGDERGQGWLSYLVQLLVWTCFSLSFANAFFVFTRKRHYRLFEANIDKQPGTSSAQRVRVQSSPSTSSPFRLLSGLLSAETAESRAHPDSTRDVWELAIWDPRPSSLALLSFFSPLHVLIYVFELPLDPLEPRPSVAVFKCLLLQAGLSIMMQLLQAKNDQRMRDAAVIQKEVLHEYDAKFVRPQLHPIVRDMGTQVTMNDILSAGAGNKSEQIPVEVGKPTTLIRRTFQTHPNANYMKHIDPDYGTASMGHQPISAAAHRLRTPASKPARHSDPYSTPVYSSAVQSRQSKLSAVTPSYTSTGSGTTPATATATPAASISPEAPATVAASSLIPVKPGAQATPTAGATPRAPLTASNTMANFGGSMGVYSHMSSPLKKTTSMNGVISSGGNYFSPRNSREAAAFEQRQAAERMQRRTASPIKEERPQTGFRTQESNPFARAKPNPYSFERFPSRR